MAKKPLGMSNIARGQMDFGGPIVPPGVVRESVFFFGLISVFR